jgi:metallo-beta-lactamase class B
MRRIATAALLLTLGTAQAIAADDGIPPGWYAPEAPFRIAGNTWYVGSHGISMVLIRGDEGAILLDAGVPQAMSNFRDALKALDIAPNQIKLILTSHAHFDHIGALADLKTLTGARVLASAESAVALADGGRTDLHFREPMPFAPVVVDGTVVDGETIHLGELAITAHLTPGHTPGSTTWTWTETGDAGPISMVYADSVTAPGYRLIDHPQRPQLVDEFRATFARIAALPCDLLITPHPEASNLFERVRNQPVTDAERARGSTCKGYAARASESLDRQIAEQRKQAQ